MAKGLLGALSVATTAAGMTWQEYKNEYGLNFNSNDEDEYRQSIFEQHMAFIEQENQLGHSYELGVNNFVHLTEEEMDVMKGLRRSHRDVDLPKLEESEVVEVAAAVDWRTAGILNPIKNQGSCGSCWAFSAVAILEAHKAQKTGILQNLAEQQLVDCSKAGSCNGGDEWDAIDWYAGRLPTGSLKHGACKTSTYPYAARDQTCKESSCTYGINAGLITGYIYGSKNSDSSMISYLNNGVVSSGVYAGNEWSYYSTGIVGVACNGHTQNHAIAVVGYTADAYIVRNSWGTGWGENGHIRIKRGLSGDAASCILQWEPMQPKITLSTELTV
jgi:C1A family cysteine protease